MATTTKCAVCGKETHFTRMSMITFEDLCIACREIEDNLKREEYNMEFTVETMRDIVNGESDKFDSVEESVVDTSRWSIHYEMVFQSRETGKCYRTYFQRGATEIQDERPFEYDTGMIECTEVVKQNVIRSEWVRV